MSIGILTYNAPRTLERTLKSYTESHLNLLSNDVFVVIQKSPKQEEEKKVCEKLKIQHYCLLDNGLMAWGFKQIYEKAKHEFVLFLENDFLNKNSLQITKNFIDNSLYFLQQGYDIVRARSRFYAGEPNYALQAMKNLEDKDLVNNSHLSESIFWIEHPHERFPTRISKIITLKGDEEWYTCSSKYCNYTNNPYICSKSFFEKNILPFIEFGKNLESELTKKWSEQDHKCVFGPGLFTHDRLDGH